MIESRPTDATLLATYAQGLSGAEVAFEQLVARHGRMVHDVCVRILGNHAAAEDAAQATFVVLALKAKSVRESVEAFLHGVAVNVARRGRDAEHLRKRRELESALQRDTNKEGHAWDELCPHLDEAIAQLSRMQHRVLVLAFFEGHRQREIAAVLRISEKSVHAHLCRALEKLRARLSRRGLTVSSVILHEFLAARSTEAKCPGWLISASGAIAATATGGSKGNGVLSSSAVPLAKGVLKMMFWGKVKVGLLMAAAFLVLGGSLSVFSGDTIPTPVPPQVSGVEKEIGNAEGPRVQLPALATARFGSLTYRHGEELSAILFTPDQKFMITDSFMGALVVWNRKTGQEHLYLPDSSGCYALSSDGRLLATGGQDKKVRIWDVQEARMRSGWEVLVNSVDRLALDPTGNLLAAGSSKARTLSLWDLDKKEKCRERTLEAGDWMGAVVFSPDGGTVAAAWGEQDLIFWKHREDVLQSLHFDEKPGHFCPLFNTDGSRLAIWSPNQPKVRVYDGKSRQQLFVAEHSSSITSIRFDPSGRFLVVSDSSGLIRFWNLATNRGEFDLVAPSWNLSSLDFSPDGVLLASSDWGGTVRLWDLGKRSIRREFKQPGVIFRAARFTPDGQHIAAGGKAGCAVYLWEVASGKRLHPEEGHEQEITALAFSRDGKRLAMGSRDHRITVWNSQQAHLQFVLERHTLPINALAFSPEGNLLFSAGGNQSHGEISCGPGVPRTKGELFAWDLEKGCLHHELTGHLASVNTVVLAKDGKTVLSGSDDGTIRWWNSASGAPLHHSDGAGVSSIQLSPDGKKILAQDYGGPIGQWDVESHVLENKWSLSDPLVKDKTAQPIEPLVFWQRYGNGFTLWDWNRKTSVQTISLDPPNGMLQAFALSPDGKLAAAGVWRDSRLHLFDLATGKPLPPVPGHRGSITALAFSTDGTRLASGSIDTTTLVWDVQKLSTR